MLNTVNVLMPLLAGKVAIATGGAEGAGRATSLRLAKEGASLVIADTILEFAE